MRHQMQLPALASQIFAVPGVCPTRVVAESLTARCAVCCSRLYIIYQRKLVTRPCAKGQLITEPTLSHGFRSHQCSHMGCVGLRGPRERAVQTPASPLALFLPGFFCAIPVNRARQLFSSKPTPKVIQQKSQSPLENQSTDRKPAQDPVHGRKNLNSFLRINSKRFLTRTVTSF